MVGRFPIRLIVAVVLFLFFDQAQAAPAGALVQRQDIAVTLVPDQHRVVGESTITFAAGVTAISLRLAEGARVDSVTATGKKVPYSFTKGEIHLESRETAGALVVTVSYSATFNDPVSQHPAASEDPSYGVSGAITREGTFLGGGSYWYPVPVHVPQKRTLAVTAPVGTEAVTYGRRVSRETVGGVTRSLWEESRPVGVLSMSAGPYRVEEKRVGEVALYSYLYPANERLSASYLDAAAKYITYYSDLFGPYPFEKFAVVENFFPTGYGFPSFTLLGGTVIRLPFIIETSFPHEIAHSWWGNAIDVDPREGNWAEGLVTYLADYLLKERRSTSEARDYRRQLLIDYASLVAPAVDFPLSAFTSRSDPPSRAIGYGKGAMVFHMIRSRIGDEAFFRGLRQVCRDHLYGMASWSDLLKAFSASSGQDIATVVKPWLTRPGGPGLSLAEVTSRQEGRGWRVSGALLQERPLFDLVVPLEVHTSVGQVRKEVTVRSERTHFSFLTAAAPTQVILDPGADVFRVLAKGEIPPTVNSIKGSSQLIGVVTENCRASRETFKAFMASLSQGEAPLIKEDELDEAKGRQRDLLFCGVPRNRLLLNPVPGGVEVVGPTEFRVEGKPFSGEDGLLMLVSRPEVASGRVVALFQPLSEASAVQYSRKITHYGKYSYLAFSGGSIRVKGLGAATGGGVVVNLKQ